MQIPEPPMLPPTPEPTSPGRGSEQRRNPPGRTPRRPRRRLSRGRLALVLVVVVVGVFGVARLAGGDGDSSPFPASVPVTTDAEGAPVPFGDPSEPDATRPGKATDVGEDIDVPVPEPAAKPQKPRRGVAPALPAVADVAPDYSLVDWPDEREVGRRATRIAKAVADFNGANGAAVLARMKGAISPQARLELSRTFTNTTRDTRKHAGRITAITLQDDPISGARVAIATYIVNTEVGSTNRVVRIEFPPAGTTAARIELAAL